MREFTNPAIDPARWKAPQPSLGLDLDGCIDVAPIFFRMLTKTWDGTVFIISYRGDENKAMRDLEKYEIYYHSLILVDSLAEKAKVIADKGILVFFDDQPETMKFVPPTVNVMLVRNGGNFDFDDKLWMFSAKTAKLI